MAASSSQHPNADVRMRGFAQRTTVEDALAWVDRAVANIAALSSQDVSLLQAAGRTLARDIESPVNVPDFNRAMMDGLAVVADDTSGATSYNALHLKLLGSCFPSQPFEGQVSRGSAVRIMTGAPMPRGADAVLPIENAEIDADRVAALNEVSPGKHVGHIAEDVRQGDIVLRRGRTLRPQDIGLLSSLGFANIPVLCRPRVRILITGNELLPMGTWPSGY